MIIRLAKKLLGPQEMLDSISGAGGFVVIGDTLAICATISIGSGSFGSNNINGFPTSRMELVDVTQEEAKRINKALDF